MQLFFSNQSRVLLLDPYLAEIDRSISTADLKRRKIVSSGLSNDEQTLTVTQLERIRKYILRKNSLENVEAEWNTFLRTFLPSLQTHLVNELTEKESVFNTLTSFRKSGRYSVLRSTDVVEKFGNSHKYSIEHTLLSILGIHDFDMEDLIEYFNQSMKSTSYETLQVDITDLLTRTRKRSSTARHLLASQADSAAVLQCHLMNEYFKSRSIPVEVDLVSRDLRLANVISSLPQGLLNFSLRHPLFIPEIYNFSDSALSNIVNILGEVDQSLTTISETQNQRARQSAIKTTCTSAMVAITDMEAIKAAEEIAREVIPEVISEVAHKAYNGSERKKLENKITTVISALAKSIDEGTDPISQNVWRKIGDMVRNDALRSWLEKNPRITIKVRITCVSGTNETSPFDYYVVRAVEPYVGVICKFYSNAIFKFFEKQAGVCSPDYLDGHYHYELQLNAREAVSMAIEAIEDLSLPDHPNRKTEKSEILKDEDGSLLSGLEAVLLSALVARSFGFVNSSNHLTTAALKPIILALRNGETTEWKGSRNAATILLGFRELLLFRHHCERNIALTRFFDPLRIGHYEDINQVTVDFSWAQRDLDLSVLMTEVAGSIFSNKEVYERSNQICWNTITNDDTWLDAGPMGNRHFVDFRHLINHVSGWIDQLVVVSSKAFKENPPSAQLVGGNKVIEGVNRRQMLWAATGFAKELELSAFDIRKQSNESTGRSDGLNRYLAHLEARTLQLALMLYICGMSFRLAPNTQRFVLTDGCPHQHQRLTFRNWKHWWKRYQSLREDNEMNFRMNRLIDPICEALIKIESPENNNLKVQADLVNSLNNVIINHKDRFTMCAIANSLIVRIQQRGLHG